MKKIIIISMLLYVPVQLFSQPFDEPPHRMREKLSQLEKIKLIETLKMDEETTLKFFSRRTEHQTRMDDLSELADKTINEMETMLKSESKYSPEQLKSLIDKANSLHAKMEEERAAFINSLNDILTTEQIAKLIIFERRFKDELRRVLFRDRKHMNRD